MPGAVAAFIITLGTQILIVKASVAAALFAATVVAALTQAASVIVRKLFSEKPPAITLDERKQNLQVPTPSRKILYGNLEIGGAVISIDVLDQTSTSILGGGLAPNHYPEVHIANYRNAGTSTFHSTAAENSFPVVRRLATGLPARSSNRVDELTIYYSNRPQNDWRLAKTKQMEVMYALADNQIEIDKVFLNNEEATGSGISLNRVSDPANGRYHYGDLYIYNRDHNDETETNLKSAQQNASDLGTGSPGFSAAFIWDGSGNGKFLDIVAPLGLPAYSFTETWFRANPSVFRGYHISPNAPFGIWDPGIRVAGNSMGNGVALMAATFFGRANSPEVSWPSIPTMTVEAKGYIPTSTWNAIRNLPNIGFTFWSGLTYNNAAACCYDYLLRFTDYGNPVLGQSRIDEASVGQAIRDCEDLGLTCNALVDLTNRPDDVLTEFAKAMRMGDIYDVGGVAHMIVGKPVPVSESIGPDDILADWQFVGGLARDDRPDAIIVEYPTVNSLSTDTVVLGNDFIRGGGSGRTAEIVAGFVGSREQALDVAAITLLLSQESQGLEINVRAAKANLLPNDTINLTMPVLFGDAPKKFRVLSVSPNADLSVRLTLREERDAIWDGHDFISGAGFLLLESSTEDAPMHVLLEDGSKVIV